MTNPTQRLFDAIPLPVRQTIDMAVRGCGDEAEIVAKIIPRIQGPAVWSPVLAMVRYYAAVLGLDVDANFSSLLTMHADECIAEVPHTTHELARWAAEAARVERAVAVAGAEWAVMLLNTDGISDPLSVPMSTATPAQRAARLAHLRDV